MPRLFATFFVTQYDAGIDLRNTNKFADLELQNGNGQKKKLVEFFNTRRNVKENDPLNSICEHLRWIRLRRSLHWRVAILEHYANIWGILNRKI